MYKIMIIEDDVTIAKVISEHLKKWGYETACVNDFEKVTEQVFAFEPHLILLDIMLPFFNGFYWCTKIRCQSSVPIVFLSSASDNMNMVMAMNMGADDFISKPFDLQVLTAKIQALLRRTYSFAENTKALEHRGVLLNLADATLTYEGRKIDLTKNEFRILQLLMERTGHVVERDTIMECLWESDSFIDDNTLTVNVTRLRKKLDEAGISEFIVTKKGIGYLVK
ncbi:response regulator transcription factor [Ruminococcus sp. OA3]|uniref:response regulator transcription factor n=1 Tax=Ruminococcus sp. OA3 TaxID=2914164 RepID=UPI001F0594F1|nr:response regulator transcription factor [Ruminococcus sp. OA3]MCH1982066.1 response regulator transcription factor [Ruminococcus sp. OA3]